MNIGMPHTIRIGGLDYTVGVMSRIEADSHGVDAMVRFYEQRIEIREGMHPQTTAEKLLHEVLHGAWDAAHLPEEGIDEETAVTQLSKSLFQILRDNPRLVSFLASGGEA